MTALQWNLSIDCRTDYSFDATEPNNYSNFNRNMNFSNAQNGNNPPMDINPVVSPNNELNFIDLLTYFQNELESHCKRLEQIKNHLIELNGMIHLHGPTKKLIQLKFLLILHFIF